MTKRGQAIIATTGILGVGLGVPLAGADAGTVTVRQAIAGAERSFSSSPAFAYVKSHAKKLTTTAEVKAALPRFETVGKLYSETSHYVASSTASTTTEATARTSWVRGTQLASQEYAALVTEFKDILSGNKTGTQASLRTALGLAKRAAFDIEKADRLLGLPKGA